MGMSLCSTSFFLHHWSRKWPPEGRFSREVNLSEKAASLSVWIWIGGNRQHPLSSEKLRCLPPHCLCHHSVQGVRNSGMGSWCYVSENQHFLPSSLSHTLWALTCNELPQTMTATKKEIRRWKKSTAFLQARGQLFGLWGCKEPSGYISFCAEPRSCALTSPFIIVRP